MYFPPTIKYRVPSNQDVKRPIYSLELGHNNNIKIVTQRQRHVTKTFGCCLGKMRWWDVSLTLWILVKVTLHFMEYLYFLNIISNGIDLGKHLESFAKLPGGNSTGPGEFNFFLYFPTKFFEFSFNPRCKIWWAPGHLDRFYQKLNLS